MQRFSKTSNSSTDLFRSFREFSQFTWDFTTTEESIIRASGFIDVQHRGIYIPGSAIMVAIQLRLDDAWLKGSKRGSNILGAEDHYEMLPVFGNTIIQPGDHSISVWMRSASGYAPNTDGLAEMVPNGYNQVVYEVETLS